MKLRVYAVVCIITIVIFTIGLIVGISLVADNCKEAQHCSSTVAWVANLASPLFGL